MKYISIAVVLALVTGCGGGGGAAPNPGPGGQTNAQLTQQILQACAQGNVDFLIEILGVLQGLADPGTPVPTLNITGIDVPTLSLTWELDLDGDMLPDIAGTLGIDDGAGGFPAIDFTPIVSQGIAGLPQVLATLADGDRMIVTVQNNDPLNMFTANVFITWLNNLPNTADGQIDGQSLDCTAQIQFQQADVATLFTGGTPTASFDILMTGVDGTINGTMAFDGSNTVTFNVMFGNDNFTFEFDIVTGQVTQVP